MTLVPTEKPERCVGCDIVLEGEALTSAARTRGIYDSIKYWHPACLEEARATEAARRAEYERSQREQRAGGLRHRFQQWNAAKGDHWPPDRFPKWEWARFNNEEFRSRVKQRGGEKMLTGVESWSPNEGSLLLLGPTGRAKTATCVAWLWRMRDQAIAAVLRGEEATGFVTFCWATGHDLVKARKQRALGEGEAPLIEIAMGAGVLVLDELGFESAAPDPIVFEVVNARYAASLPTIVTTGLPVKDFRARYGDALFRRLIEPGKYVEIT